MADRSTPARYWSTRPSRAANSARATTCTMPVRPEAVQSVGQGTDVVLVEGGHRFGQLGPPAGLEDHLVLKHLQFRFSQQQLQQRGP